MRRTRVVEVMAALSLTTDLASGLPFEKGLQVCLVGDALAGVLGLEHDDRLAVFEAALLRSIGCTSHAPENAALFLDDTAFQAALKRLDPGDPEVFLGQLSEFGSWAPDPGALAARFADIAPTEGPAAAATGCEVRRWRRGWVRRRPRFEPSTTSTNDGTAAASRSDGLGTRSRWSPG